ncbi:hypothetical protein MCHIJ_42800 [Mycolicibacterium chitae]|uniref:Transmembrane protein n=1 Tax=Mycolicibacterium chitae TaxID=1792 RepID=A0A3S5EIG2_MYCCI|nr:hypothetical protein [Mycolicibacterium chitae]MCV7109167.1 hypothetical protein [Mycolicibacterium chitae]BBZ04843.1 hypothetical protein MCHIJ_42800 [Mycolicibacterium chitae]VEG48467.1 Uncharacterised protein [Mycolicibacterium chitae]
MSEAKYEILADTGGLVVTDDGRRVVVIDRQTGPASILAFVLGLLGVVLLGFGVAALVIGTVSTIVALAFVVAGLLAAAATVWLVRQVRTRRSQPLGSCHPAAVLDRKLGLFSSSGGALMPLGEVRFERRLQLTSSSPKLVAVTPNGTRVLKRGSPFDGGVREVHDVLNAVAQGR